jgi:general secretion pathway protein G
MRTRLSKAFTLVEILIVVVILGILAAIVVPQFTNASQDAQVGNVETQLQTIRSQIELFRVRNNGNYPPALVAGGPATPAAPGAWADLVGADYMRSVPINPRTNTADVVAGANPNTPVAQGAPGWYFDSATHDFTAAGFDEINHRWY